MNAKPRRYRILSARLALAGISTLIMLALVEAGLRAFFHPGTVVMTDFTEDHYERHPVLGWVPRKNTAGVHTKEGSFVTRFRTNSRGLRDREHALTRSPSTARVVVLGDSFTWGWGVQDDEVYPAVLETLLDRTEVINLGVTAYDTRQEFEYLKLEGILYQPDVVLVGFCLNDIYPQKSRISGKETGSAPTSRAAEAPAAPVKRWMSEHVALYQLTKQAVNNNKWLAKGLVRLGVKDHLNGFDQLDVNLMPALREYPPELQRSFEGVEKELLELRDYLRQRDVRLILVLIPSLQSLDESAFLRSIGYSVFERADFDLARPYRLLEEFGRRSGVEVIDAYESLKHEQDAGGTLYLTNDIHFNARGQRALARRIAAYLQQHPVQVRGE